MKENIPTTEDIFLSTYTEYSDAIFRFCLMKTSKREVALDLTQESFTKLWEYISDGNEVREMRPLLYRIAANLVIDYYRKKKAESLDALTEKGIDIEGTDNINKNSQIEELYRKLEIIDPKYKDILILRFVNDLSVKEIAEIYDEHENTISVRIHRAVEKLREVYTS